MVFDKMTNIESFKNSETDPDPDELNPATAGFGGKMSNPQPNEDELLASEPRQQPPEKQEPIDVS